jgi:hypothetical protein
MAVSNQLVNTPSESRAVPTILTVTHKDSLKLPALPQFEKIIDTGDPECSLIGSGWFASANSGFWPPTPAQLNPIGDGSSYAEFRLEFPATAIYEVYGWWVASSNRCTDTPFIIKHKNGTDTVRVDQTQNGSIWKLIGTYQFSADTSQKIIVSNAGTEGTYVVADAIRLISYDPVTTIKDDLRVIPEEFGLLQNYPNPFNPSTLISYQLPSSSFVQLKVYDVLGNEVEELVNGYEIPGVYKKEFDATDLPSGVYFYRLQTDRFTDVRKMLLIK